MQFRRCKDVDTRAVERLFTQVFTQSEGASEGRVIGDLVVKLMKEVEESDLYGYMAAEDEHIIGGIFFSRLRFETPLDAFLLSPVAVDTRHHGKGVGQGLIRFGLDAMREQGADLVCTYGDPHFYSKIGFASVDTDTVPSPFALTQPEGWLCQWLNDAPLAFVEGPSHCVAPFDNPDYW